MEEEIKMKEELKIIKKPQNVNHPDNKNQLKDEANLISNQGKYILFSQEDLRSIIQNKIIFLSNLHNFFYNFSLNINKIISKLNNFASKKIENTLDQHKNFLKFFKDTIVCYERFSADLLKSKAVLSSSIIDEKLIFSEINMMIDKSQESLSNNFLYFTTLMNKKVLQEGPFTKTILLYKRIKDIIKSINEEISRFQTKLDSLNYKYRTNQWIFDRYRLAYKSGDKTLSVFLSKNEFFLIESNYTKTVNKLIDIMKVLLKSYVGYYSEMKAIIIDYLALMKETIGIYINANSKVFTESNNVESIIKAFGNVNKETIDQSFIPEIFFREIVKEINECLKELEVKINEYDFLKIEDKLKEGKFLFQNYQSLSEFFQFLNDLIPQKYDIEQSNLLTFSCDVERHPGLFRKIRPSKMVITVQNNLYMFDYKKYKRFDQKICLEKNFSFYDKRDKISLFRMEIQEKQNGVLFNSSEKVLIDACSKDNFINIAKVLSNYTKDSNINKDKSINDHKKEEEIIIQVQHNIHTN